MMRRKLYHKVGANERKRFDADGWLCYYPLRDRSVVSMPVVHEIPISEQLSGAGGSSVSSQLTRQLSRILIAVVLLVLVSVVGFMRIEGYSLLDAVYMTVITLSTVGFGEVHPLSPAGRVFTIAVILLGVGTGAYLFRTVAEYIIAGELTGTLRQRRIMRTVENLRDHYLVCGYGRVGQQVTAELRSLGLPFVVIDRDRAAIERCEQRDIPVVEGDATEDEVLRRAGIERARGLVAVLDSDADNVFVVLSARSLNPDLMIVARATSEDAERKLLKAGADRVVSPYLMAGYRIVSLLVRPHVVGFLDTALHSQDLELWLEELVVSPDSPLIGQSLAEANIRAHTGANVLAIIRGPEHRVVDWSPELRLEPNDILIVLGKPPQLEALAELAGSKRFARVSRLHELVRR